MPEHRYKVQLVNTLVPFGAQGGIFTGAARVGEFVKNTIESIEELGRLDKVGGPWSLSVLVEHVAEEK